MLPSCDHSSRTVACIEAEHPFIAVDGTTSTSYLQNGCDLLLAKLQLPAMSSTIYSSAMQQICTIRA
jgi:hypothetical protein